VGIERGFHRSSRFSGRGAAPYRNWDLIERREMDYIERPLIFMDSTYAQRIERALKKTFQRSGKYGHRLTVLFHNTSMANPLGLDKYVQAKVIWMKRL